MTLPSSWSLAPLADCCDVILGQSPPGDTYNEEAKGLPFFQGKAEFGALFPTVKKWCTAPTKIATKDDVLISVRAPVGPTNLCPDEACIGRGLAAVRPKAGIPSRYVLYAIRASEEALRSGATGTTFEAVSGERLRRHAIPIAPLPEEHAIVAEIEKQFTRLDDAVVALRRVQANLKRYRASVLKAACEGRLVPTEAELARKEGRDYEPASELLRRILAERRAKWRETTKYAEPNPPANDLPKLPYGWVWASLSQLLREPLRNGHSAKESLNGAGVRTLTLTAVTYGDFSESNVKVTSADPDRVRDLWIQPGDIFVERSNAPELVGLARLFRGSPNFAIFPDLLIRVRLSSYVEPKYVEAVLLSERGRQYFRASAQGISGSMPKIDQGIIEELPVPLPPIAEQRRIAIEIEDRLAQLTASEHDIVKGLRLAGHLRQAILKDAFSGQLVPQDPKDEPASVLLERIRAVRAHAQEQKEKTPKAANSASPSMPAP